MHYLKILQNLSKCFKNYEIHYQSFQFSPGTSCWIVCTTLVFKTNWGGRGGWSFYTKMPRQPQPYHPPPPNAHVCYAAAGLRENSAWEFSQFWFLFQNLREIRWWIGVCKWSHENHVISLVLVYGVYEGQKSSSPPNSLNWKFLLPKKVTGNGPIGR